MKTSQNTYWHASNSDLQENQLLVSKKNSPYFGDYEKLLERFRPITACSRLNSFYLSNNKNYVEQFGNNLYKVEPIGDYTICAIGWFGIMSALLNKNGLVKGMVDGKYKLEKLPKEAEPTIEEIVYRYFSGVPPTAKDLEVYDLKSDAETKVLEVLAPKIRIIKSYS
jgi:hypothetical protein